MDEGLEHARVGQVQLLGDGRLARLGVGVAPSGGPLGLLALDGEGSGLRVRGWGWEGAEGDTTTCGGERLEEALELGAALEGCQLVSRGRC
jgi:hypothetical protein